MNTPNLRAIANYFSSDRSFFDRHHLWSNGTELSKICCPDPRLLQEVGDLVPGPLLRFSNSQWSKITEIIAYTDKLSAKNKQ